MAAVESDRLYGTLNLLVLQTLEQGRRHGLAILREIEAAATSLKIEEGALYPALHRLERDGCLEGEWGLSESRRRAKFYRLTDRGRQRLRGEVESWVDHTRAVAAVLGLELELAAGVSA
ncbi:MAG: PadR family transcriptional regulator [Acidobacteria bacterium]|nr:MAG: PadR family transcriptional regulator [Acidobacteriota bacterium]REK08706.1 MAG: PadR family transcriptional regulator [Acidobacteriota bacterium]